MLNKLILYFHTILYAFVNDQLYHFMQYSVLALDTKRTSENETSSSVRSLCALDYRSKEPFDQSERSTYLVERRNLNITATPSKAMRRNRPISEIPITQRTIYLNETLALLLFSDPHFQWGEKSSSVLRFFPKFCQISTLHHLTHHCRW